MFDREKVVAIVRKFCNQNFGTPHFIDGVGRDRRIADLVSRIAHVCEPRDVDGLPVLAGRPARRAAVVRVLSEFETKPGDVHCDTALLAQRLTDLFDAWLVVRSDFEKRVECWHDADGIERRETIRRALLAWCLELSGRGDTVRSMEEIAERFDIDGLAGVLCQTFVSLLAEAEDRRDAGPTAETTVPKSEVLEMARRRQQFRSAALELCQIFETAAGDIRDQIDCMGENGG